MIVNQYTSISSFAAVIVRLVGFVETAEATHAAAPSIVTQKDSGRGAYQALMLRPGDGVTLISDLSV